MTAAYCSTYTRATVASCVVGGANDPVPTIAVGL